jgi:hypothetical protein
MKNFFFLGLLMGVFVAGCTKPPNFPTLPQRQKLPIQTLDLGGHLEGKDVREIFKVLNNSGSLDRLKPFFQDPSDASLNQLMGLVDRYIYQDALSSRGFLSLFIQKQTGGTFNKWLKALRELTTSPHYPELGEWVLRELAKPSFPTLIEHDSVLLEPLWGSLFQDWRKGSTRWKNETAQWSSNSTIINWQDWVSESRKLLLTDPGLGKKLDKFVVGLQETNILEPLWEVLNPVVKKKGASDFIGLSLGLSHMAKTPYTIQKSDTEEVTVASSQLLAVQQLIRDLESPPNGFFSFLKKKIETDPRSATLLATLLQPDAEDGLAGYYPWIENAIAKRILWNLQKSSSPFNTKTLLALPRKNPDDPPTEAFKRTFNLIVDGISDIKGERSKEKFDSFSFNLSIYLNAYALTCWLEETARLNPSLKEKQDLWKTPLYLPERWILNLDNNKKVANDLDSLRPEFKETLLKQNNRSGLGLFFYELNFTAKQGLLTEVLIPAVTQIGKSRPFSDLSPAVRASILGLIDEEPGVPNWLIEMERVPSLMDALNSFMSVQSPQTWKYSKRMLFEKWQIGLMSDTMKDAIVGLYEGHTDIQERLRRVLDRIQVVYEMDRSPQAPWQKDLFYPSAFSFYQTTISPLGSSQRKTLHSLFEISSSLRLFDLENGKPLYPGFYSAVTRSWVRRATATEGPPGTSWVFPSTVCSVNPSTRSTRPTCRSLSALGPKKTRSPGSGSSAPGSHGAITTW